MRETDLREPLREGATDAELEGIIRARRRKEPSTGSTSPASSSRSADGRIGG